MGIATAGRVAGEKTTLKAHFSLDLLSDKQDNPVHEANEKSTRTGAGQSWRKDASGEPIRCGNRQDSQQGREGKSREAVCE